MRYIIDRDQKIVCVDRFSFYIHLYHVMETTHYIFCRSTPGKTVMRSEKKRQHMMTQN